MKRELEPKGRHPTFVVKLQPTRVSLRLIVIREINVFSPITGRTYTREHLSHVRTTSAEFIAFGPMVFEVSRIMVKWGILDRLRDEQLTVDEVDVARVCSTYAQNAC